MTGVQTCALPILPDFILNNFRWKIGALTLSIFVWFLIQFAISKGYQPNESPLTDLRERTFSEQPVFVLTAPDNTQAFHLTPAKVEITIRATAIGLSRLAKSEVKAFVDLADATNVVSEIKEVFARTPVGTEISSIKVKPPSVTVERGGVP